MELDYSQKGWRLNAIKRMHKLFLRMNFDCICAFVSDVAVLSRIASLGVKSTFFSAERGDPYVQRKIWSILTKWAYGRSDGCIFQLEKARDYYDKKIIKKSFVIANPYIAKKEKTIIDSLERKKTIVSAGRFEWQKGYDILISAFSIFVRRFPDYRLVLYGEGTLKKDYLRQAEELDILEKIQFPGYIPNVAAAIEGDGIFVLPSRFEGIPNVLIEAMATGIPTISTDCSPGGPRFLTDNGRRGLLIDVDDVDGLVKALEKLACDQKYALKVGQLGTEVVGLLDKETIQKQWVEVFEKCL